MSDAGSPLISDPAFPIILKAIEDDVKLESIGRISSVISALELSGLAPIPFHFHGFLARDKSKFKGDMQKIGTQYGTHIFFEGKSRVMTALDSLTQAYPELKFALCREITKDFESVYRFMGSEFQEIKDDITVKGEFVILVGNDKKQIQNTSSEEAVKLANEIIETGAKPKKMAKLLSLITGKPTKDIYNTSFNK